MEIPSYGFCPVCGGHGQSRERRPEGNDHCVRGHTYPSREAVTNVQDTKAIQTRHSMRDRVEVVAELREKHVKAWQISRTLPEIEWLNKAITAGSVSVCKELEDGKEQVLSLSAWTPFGKANAGLGDWIVRTATGQVVAMANSEFQQTFIVHP